MGTNDDVENKTEKSDMDRAERIAQIDKILQDLDYAESKESAREARFYRKEKETQHSNSSDSWSTYQRRTAYARQFEQTTSAKQTNSQQIKTGQSKKTKQPKKPSKVWNFICIYAWFNVFGVGLFFLIVPDWFEMSTFTGLVVSSILMFFSVMRISRRFNVVMYKALPLRKKFTNKIAAILLFVPMIAASALYYMSVYGININSFAQGFVPVHVGSQNPDFSEIIPMLAWVLPICIYAMCIEVLMLTSIRRFVMKLLIFFIKYVLTFVLFLFITTALSYMVSTLGVFLMGDSFGSGNIWTSLSGYFQFTLDADLGEEVQLGFLSTSSVFISTLTGAASYRELTDICMDHMYEKRTSSFISRLTDYFKKPDCILLIVMTVFSAVSSVVLHVLAQGSGSQIAKVAYYVFAIGWVIAGVLFVIDTKVIPYLASFALMYFVEEVISVSLFGGMQLWSATILVWGIRLVCFSYMAALITFMINFSKEYDSSYMKNPEFSSHFMEGNIIKVCSAFAKVYKDA